MHDTASLTHLMTKLVLQLATIVIFSKIFGLLINRYFKQPSVLGELAAGMVIGPYALGGIPLFGGEPLFIIPQTAILPITPELYGFATVASIVLLFLSGLQTDLKTFLRFAGTGSVVGIGGVIVTFFLGAGSAVLILPEVHTMMDPRALFMGTISTATSVGITARILSERQRLSSPEGVTILSAAVLDDVLGIILLAVVAGLMRDNSTESTQIDWALVRRITVKAFGFWIGSTVIGILLAPRLTKSLKGLRDMESLAMIAFGLALLLAGLSETAGLAMIIGAYVMGLALSGTDVAENIQHRLEGIASFIVPVFFCVMGMLVDFSVLPGIALYGLIFTVLGILGKMIGCGIPALLSGFNIRGAVRIGAGMLPRGEVTLIMAGLGLSIGILDSRLFGVVVMAMFLSSLIAPPTLVRAFRGESGFRGKLNAGRREDFHTISFSLPGASLADLVLVRLLEAFRQAEFFPRKVSLRKPVYVVQKDADHITLLRNDDTISLNMPPHKERFVRLLLTEELLAIKDLFHNIQHVAESNSMERDMLTGLFESNQVDK